MSGQINAFLPSKYAIQNGNSFLNHFLYLLFFSLFHHFLGFYSLLSVLIFVALLFRSLSKLFFVHSFLRPFVIVRPYVCLFVPIVHTYVCPIVIVRPYVCLFVSIVRPYVSLFVPIVHLRTFTFTYRFPWNVRCRMKAITWQWISRQSNFSFDPQ